MFSLIVICEHIVFLRWVFVSVALY